MGPTSRMDQGPWATGLKGMNTTHSLVLGNIWIPKQTVLNENEFLDYLIYRKIKLKQPNSPPDFWTALQRPTRTTWGLVSLLQGQGLVRALGDPSPM